MKIAANSKLLMIGDSITDCSRARPIGEGSDIALGHGYVRLVDNLLKAAHPAHPIHITNMGIGGNTARDLRDRWQTDVLDLQPDWLSIMIGINDVWRQIDHPSNTAEHVVLEEYIRILTDLIAATRPLLTGLILMTPYVIEPNRDDPMRAMMGTYGQAVKELAVQYEASFIDTQAAFDEVLASVSPYSLAEDRVHPNQAGHMILARAFLKNIGFVW
jgi:lysophospholipase L1-like esterase